MVHRDGVDTQRSSDDLGYECGSFQPYPQSVTIHELAASTALGEDIDPDC